MRNIRIVLCILALLPASSYAATGMLDAASTVDQLNLLIRQYDTRIKQLESENAVLKNEMVKSGIKIPLSDFSGAVATPLPTKTTTGTTTASVTPSVSVAKSETTLFIERITTDWSAIQKAYSLPQTSRIAGYEFVQSGALDHVFVDLVYTTSGTGGVYDAKILYQYEKKEYKRKLIGFFVYDPKTEKYITKSGANPFGGVARNFIRDPNFSGTATPPLTALTGSTVTPGVATGSTNTGVTPTIIDISKAYSEKRYLTTISLANTYLAANPNNTEVLDILYRTYFITSKFEQSLSILAKIEALGKLDRTTACNAYAIAKYAQNASLTTKYSDICYKK